MYVFYIYTYMYTSVHIYMYIYIYIYVYYMYDCDSGARAPGSKLVSQMAAPGLGMASALEVDIIQPSEGSLGVPGDP